MTVTSSPQPELLAQTRESWHRVAEHVLAAGQYADTGKIALRPVAGGFETRLPLRGKRVLSVVNTEARHRPCRQTYCADHNARCGRGIRRRHARDAGQRLPTSDTAAAR